MYVVHVGPRMRLRIQNIIEEGGGRRPNKKCHLSFSFVDVAKFNTPELLEYSSTDYQLGKVYVFVTEPGTTAVPVEYT